MAGQAERTLVRLLTGGALCAALLVASLVPIPEDATGDPVLPVVALGQESLYRAEMALLVFYAVLLLMTPAFSGLVRGRLPIEISVRGARFEEKADQSVELAEARIRELRQRIGDLDDGLRVAAIEINQLKKGRSDNT